VRKLGGEEKTGGYEFAVAFLAASGSSLYIISKHLQNAPVDKGLYSVICGLLVFWLISTLGFLLYILIKAYLKEDRDTDVGYLNKSAAKLYKWSIVLFMASIPVMIYSIFMKSLQPETRKIFIVILFAGILLIIIVLGCRYIMVFRRKRSMKNSSSEKSELDTSDLDFYTLIAIFFIIFLFFMTLVSLYPQGHVTIDMKSIHYKNDTQIPVLIHVTGPNTGLSAILYQERSGILYKIYYINHIEPIFLGSESGIEERGIESSNGLIGNYMGDGNYNVFVNTTNLSAGYYELMFTRTNYHNTSTAKSFYLLNARPQSQIKQLDRNTA